jgi:hypothetical protein
VVKEGKHGGPSSSLKCLRDAIDASDLLAGLTF